MFVVLDYDFYLSLYCIIWFILVVLVYVVYFSLYLIFCYIIIDMVYDFCLGLCFWF